MKHVALFLIAAIAVQAVGVSVCQARRRGDPTPEELAKIKAAAPKTATVKPAKPRKMLVLSYQSPMSPSANPTQRKSPIRYLR